MSTIISTNQLFNILDRKKEYSQYLSMFNTSYCYLRNGMTKNILEIEKWKKDIKTLRLKFARKSAAEVQFSENKATASGY